MHPDSTITKVTDALGETLYKIELAFQGNATEAHWFRVDSNTAVLVRGHSHRPNRIEAVYQVLATKQQTLHGVLVKYPTEIRWENASTHGYSIWVTHLTKTSEINDFSPEDYTLDIPNGISTQDRIQDKHYITGGIGGTIIRYTRGQNFPARLMTLSFCLLVLCMVGAFVYVLFSSYKRRG